MQLETTSSVRFQPEDMHSCVTGGHASCFDRSLHSWQDKELRFPNKETHILASQKGMLSCVTRRQASKDEKTYLRRWHERTHRQGLWKHILQTLGEEAYPHRKRDGGEHSK